jgi:hypothetical protein
MSDENALAQPRARAQRPSISSATPSSVGPDGHVQAVVSPAAVPTPLLSLAQVDAAVAAAITASDSADADAAIARLRAATVGGGTWGRVFARHSSGLPFAFIAGALTSAPAHGGSGRRFATVRLETRSASADVDAYWRGVVLDRMVPMLWAARNADDGGMRLKEVPLPARAVGV